MNTMFKLNMFVFIIVLKIYSLSYIETEEHCKMYLKFLSNANIIFLPFVALI